MTEKIYNNYNNVVLILKFCHLSSIDANLFKTFFKMKNDFIKVQKNIAREETANINIFTG